MTAHCVHILLLGWYLPRDEGYRLTVTNRVGRHTVPNWDFQQLAMMAPRSTVKFIVKDTYLLNKITIAGQVAWGTSRMGAAGGVLHCALNAAKSGIKLYFHLHEKLDAHKIW